MKIWNIIKVSPASQLHAHELFLANGFELYTPFEIMRQSRRHMGKITHSHYAHPLTGGWLFIHFDGSNEMMFKLSRLVDARPFIHGPVTTDVGDLYEFNDIRLQNFKERLQGLCEAGKGGNDRIRARGYDPTRDNRKDLRRDYEKTEIVEFSKDDVVEFADGPWRGLQFSVKEFSDDMVKLEALFDGITSTIEAPPQALQKIA